MVAEQQQAARLYILSFPRVAGWVKKSQRCVLAYVPNSPCISYSAVYMSLSLLVRTVFVQDNKEGQVRGSAGGAHVSNGSEWPGLHVAAYTVY